MLLLKALWCTYLYGGFFEPTVAVLLTLSVERDSGLATDHVLLCLRGLTSGCFSSLLATTLLSLVCASRLSVSISSLLFLNCCCSSATSSRSLRFSISSFFSDSLKSHISTLFLSTSLFKDSLSVFSSSI